jgi:hypothetical protein
MENRENHGMLKPFFQAWKVLENHFKPKKSWKSRGIAQSSSVSHFQHFSYFSNITFRNMSKIFMEFCNLVMETTG